jgi:hypothetical protein
MDFKQEGSLEGCGKLSVLLVHRVYHSQFVAAGSVINIKHTCMATEARKCLWDIIIWAEHYLFIVDINIESMHGVVTYCHN